jgi:peptide/nickel transport system permease protein
LDRPLYEQYFIYMASLLRGNFGQSFSYGEPVLNVLLERLPATLLLVGTGYAIALVIGVLGGIYAASKHDSLTDHAILTSSLIVYSMPAFWTALLASYELGLVLRLFPVEGMVDYGVHGLAYVTSLLYHLVVPATIVGLERTVIFLRVTRASMLEVRQEDFITTAKAKGVDNRGILFRHSFRNALLPLVTVASLRLGYIFVGAVLVETVFAWPGLGRVITGAIADRDLNLLLGAFTLLSLITIFFNALADIIYGMVDPRIRYSRSSV